MGVDIGVDRYERGNGETPRAFRRRRVNVIMRVDRQEAHRLRTLYGHNSPGHGYPSPFRSSLFADADRDREQGRIQVWSTWSWS